MICTCILEHVCTQTCTNTHTLVHKQRLGCLGSEACSGQCPWKQPMESMQDWMRPFESWLVRGRSIVKDSWASCFSLSLWGRWAPNMRGLSFYHPLPPSPHTSAATLTVDCLSFCLRPLLDPCAVWTRWESMEPITSFQVNSVKLFFLQNKSPDCSDK